MFQDLETAIISMFGVGWQPGGVGHVDGEIAGYGSVEDIESSVQWPVSGRRESVCLDCAISCSWFLRRCHRVRSRHEGTYRRGVTSDE